MCIKFDVDSSSPFPFRVDTYIDTSLADHPTYTIGYTGIRNETKVCKLFYVYYTLYNTVHSVQDSNPKTDQFPPDDTTAKCRICYHTHMDYAIKDDGPIVLVINE